MRESRLWLIFLLCGPLLIFLLGIHLIFMHMNTILDFFGIKTGQVLAYNSVIQRATELKWLVLYFTLLLLGLYHGLYGLRSVLLELTPREKVVNRFVLVLGLLLFFSGTYVLMKSYMIGINPS
ncbi:hypothetical protein [Moorella sulfitireducens (nom. illeg.)]|uniref:hypothetical protein n=1 Tax=Neomoorella sulfitireducens TaxID=2972948 RepID=UPI0021ACBE4C|nr:hypothetical protein [Moorella sulfitireducens]